MGKFSKTKNKKKSVVPKGKRARAKAKLERQWGEQPINDALVPRRRGTTTTTTTSRQDTAHLTKEPHHKNNIEFHETSENNPIDHNSTKKNQLGTNNEERREEDDTEDDDESIKDAEDMMASTTTYSAQLIQNLKESMEKKKRQKQNMFDDDIDMSNSSSQEDEEDSQSFTEAHHKNESPNVDVWIPPTDPFTERFVQYSTTNEMKISNINSHENKDQNDSTVTKLKFNLKSKQHQYQLDWTVSKILLEKFRIGNDDAMPSSTEALARAEKIMRSFYLQYNQNDHKNDTLPTPFLSGFSGNLVSQLFPFLSNYADIWLSSTELGDSYRQIYTFRNEISRILQIHIINHVLNSRYQILHHNRQKIRHDEANDDENHDDDDGLFRDQGFTRPTVLVLLPTRSCCWDFVQNLLLELFERKDENFDRVDGMERFRTEYGTSNKDTDEDVDDTVSQRRKQTLRAKGPAWNDLFGDDRNDDDDYQIGIQINLTRDKRTVKTSCPGVKLFADFFKSDIILASPLALKMTIDDDSNEAKADILSSIEICVIERADVLLMQNWDHINDVLSRLNQQPKAMNNTDFSRVRPYFLSGQSEQWRQLIISSAFMDPNILSTFKRFAKSKSGSVKIKRNYREIEDTSISSIVLRTRQVFQRVPCSSFANQGADCLKYFMGKILPAIERNKQNHTMIFIPSYFDFVSLRNALLKRQQDLGGIGCIDFVSVTEYSRGTEVNRGRARFLQGRKAVLLYTGRAHFFLRHAIKGAKHIVFFGLPEYADFYPELINHLEDGLKIDGDDADESLSSSCTVLFTKYDSFSLERIVGSSNCSRMIKGDKSSFVFSSS